VVGIGWTEDGRNGTKRDKAKLQVIDCGAAVLWLKAQIKTGAFLHIAKSHLDLDPANNPMA
jgi:hypothetical protein